MGGTGDESDLKGSVADSNGINQSSRPTTTKSVGSSLRSDGKRVRLKQPRQPLYNFGGVSFKRDPTVEAIIESRKFSIIENPYTRLAQITSQAPRVSQRTNPSERRSSTIDLENEIKDTVLSSDSETKLPVSTTSALDSEGWDDGLSGEYERGQIEWIEKIKKKLIVFLIEVTPSTDKSYVQLYEETCKRLKICPCSMIIRSLNTTTINLRNYGLGPRGCAALAVVLAVSFFFYLKNMIISLYF